MQSWRHSIEGVMNSFTGRSISDPHAQRRAENKLIQLEAAISVGLVVPDTLISSEPKEVFNFLDKHGGSVVVKALRPPANRAMAAVRIESNEQSIRSCPAIYQEYISGSIHLRAHVFGEDVYTVSIETEDLDWRRNLNVPFQKTIIDAVVGSRLSSLIKALGLRMGVVDLKVRSSGEIVWFEINPQGQFLFAEALSGMPLLGYFTDFIEHEYEQSL